MAGARIPRKIKKKKVPPRTFRLGTKTYRVKSLPKPVRPVAVNLVCILHLPEKTLFGSERELLRGQKMLLQWAAKRGIYNAVMKKLKSLENTRAQRAFHREMPDMLYLRNEECKQVLDAMGPLWDKAPILKKLINYYILTRPKPSAAIRKKKKG